MNEEKKRAVVVGATSGIGQAVAEELARRGWLVGIAGRRTDKLEEMKGEHEGIVAWQAIDVCSEEAPHQLQALLSEMGGMDLYFHSSGIGYQNTQLDADKELSTIQTNALGATRMLIEAFHHFEQHGERPGQIAVISSIAGTKGLGAAPAYSATKRYLNTYLESLSQLAHIRRLKNLHITDIRPGFVQTALLDDGLHYPLQMEVGKVAREIVDKVEERKAIVTVDWRYRILVFFWKLVPRWLWVRLRVTSRKEGSTSGMGDEKGENDKMTK